MGQYEVRVDKVKNRLYIMLQGFLTDAETKAASEKIMAGIQSLKPSFDVVNDISTFKPATPQGAEDVKRTQSFAKERGVRRVMRVADENAVSAMQLARKSKEVGYQADIVASVAEADKALDS